jgi:hypothetical protein
MVMETDLSGEVVETDQLDDAGLLWLVEGAEVPCREADRRKLRYASEWARRHIVSDARDAAHRSDADLRELEQTIAGEGTPLVAATATWPSPQGRHFTVHTTGTVSRVEPGVLG